MTEENKKNPTTAEEAASIAGGAAGKLMGGILKKAVSLGAGAYFTAEDSVTKTLNTVQIPKDLIRDAIESFFDAYTLTINAEVKFTPKKKDK